MTEVSGRADVEATRTPDPTGRERPARFEVLVSTGSTVPGHVERGIPACGATDETTVRAVRMSNRRNARPSGPRAPGQARYPTGPGPTSACRPGPRAVPSGTGSVGGRRPRRRSCTAPSLDRPARLAFDVARPGRDQRRPPSVGARRPASNSGMSVGRRVVLEHPVELGLGRRRRRRRRGRGRRPCGPSSRLAAFGCSAPRASCCDRPRRPARAATPVA